MPLIAELGRRGRAVRGDGPFPGRDRRPIGIAAMRAFGFEPELVPPRQRGCTLSATSFATSDIRVTTRYDEHDLESLFGCMHEIGHGLYERGVSPTLERTPLAAGCSSACTRSQSRLWENLVGRVAAFWRWLTPAPATFPEALGGITLEALLRAPSTASSRRYIRVEADEVTYSLHIMLRFELERELHRRLALAATCPRPGTRASRTTWASPSRTTASACCRTCTGRPALRLLPDLHSSGT